jgi:hypothetical protein
MGKTCYQPFAAPWMQTSRSSSATRLKQHVLVPAAASPEVDSIVSGRGYCIAIGVDMPVWIAGLEDAPIFINFLSLRSPHAKKLQLASPTIDASDDYKTLCATTVKLCSPTKTTSTTFRR